MADQQQLNRYIPTVIDIINTTSIWENRGHTPHELARMANGGQPLPSMQAFYTRLARISGWIVKHVHKGV